MDNPIEGYIKWLKQQYKIEEWQERHLRTFLEKPPESLNVIMPKNHGRSTFTHYIIERTKEV